MSNSIKQVISLPARCISKVRVNFLLPHRVKILQKKIRENQIDFDKIRSSTLLYVAQNNLKSLGTGFYSYQFGGPPLVYASAYAALVRHLYGDLDTLSIKERNNWVNYLLKHQSEDGLFRDPLINCCQAEESDWWGWRHMTLHVLMALCALGGCTSRPLRSIQKFHSPGQMSDWLSNRNWKGDATCVSNEIQNYASMLQYARDFQDETWCQAALNEMFDWLDQHQDPKTGCWSYPGDTANQLSKAVQTGYHLWCLYFYNKRSIQYIKQIIDSCLSTQNRIGGFGEYLNSSACEDIDSIDPLSRLVFLTDYRRSEVLSALEKALPWVIVNQNTIDGGWVFRRHLSYNFVPHRMMCVAMDKSFMAYTWFRTLSLAYIAKALPNSPVAKVKWHFERFPCLQFWP